MRTSNFLLATVKETPADAEITSHKLMIRAGMIRKTASGIYSWLPLGLKVLQNVTQIIREEMNKSGALEIFMPAIQPAEVWHESGRWNMYGDQLLKIKDRHNNDFCFGPTHEEIITDLMRYELKSYKQLPMLLYQIQTKFRDEIRPRFGVMRSREFLMKDAYSFHIDHASLQKTYDIIYETYSNIFRRLGLKFRAVLADTGNIGGNNSHEFHVLASSGEDVIAYSDASDYAANLEKAEAFDSRIAFDEIYHGDTSTLWQELTIIDTPQQKTIAEICEFTKVPAQQTVKTLIVHGNEQYPLVALVVRGDHEINPIKVEKLTDFITQPLTFANDAEIENTLNVATGFIGPMNLSIPIIVDRDASILVNFMCGANQNDKHCLNVNWKRDANPTLIADIRQVVVGDKSPDGKGTLQFTRGIEVGHIFQLGQKYSKAMNATVLNAEGKPVIMNMGCYGIGVSRVVASAIEQNHDERGIVWPIAIAPFQIALVPLNFHQSENVRNMAEKLYVKLQQAGFSVLIDDRKERAGVMFADMDLIGIPHRLVLSESKLEQNVVEYKDRQASESQLLSLDNLIENLQGIIFKKL